MFRLRAASCPPSAFTSAKTAIRAFRTTSGTNTRLRSGPGTYAPSASKPKTQPVGKLAARSTLYIPRSPYTDEKSVFFILRLKFRYTIT